MYESQQVTPLVRRIRLVPPDGAARAMPDPALGDWGRARLAAADVVRHETLGAALAGVVAHDGGPVELEVMERSPDGHVRVEVGLRDGERLYGAYDADAERLDRRGEHVHLVTELHPRHRHLMSSRCDLCDSGGSQDEAPELEVGASSNYGELLLPVAWSSRGWGVYVSSARHDAVLDLGQRDPGRLAWSAPGGELDVYVVAGAPLGGLVREFTRLTGTPPLPPAWALGFLQSRFGYESFDHVHEVLARFAHERLPVHAVVFDVQWLEDHVNLRWDPEHFPDPSGNLARMAARGVRSIVITEPGTRVSASNHAAGAAIDAFACDEAGGPFDSDQWYAKRGIAGYREITPDSGALLNVFRESAADWWYDQHVPLLEQGVDAWWLDLNEPEDVTPDVRFADVDWPSSHPVLDGEDARALFAIAQQRMFARRDRARSDRRPFVLSRSGSAGSQRYGAAPWTGDIGATWHDLRVQPRLLLTAGLCGIPLTGADIGGFDGDPGPELFARWMQAGSVLPVFRAHGYMRDREPWSQGAEALEWIRPSLVLRAQLLPSIVTWARQALRAGEPLARPMLLGPLGCDPDGEVARAHALDPRWHDCHDQWYFGPLLAAPVLEEGASERRVELPAGDWVDVWTGTRHAGGGAVDVTVGRSTLPLFVPRQLVLVADPAPLEPRARSWPPSELEAWSWVAGTDEASGLLYLDDGITRMHEQGAYCLQRIAVRAGESSVERLGGAFPASRVRVVAPHPGAVAAP